MIQAKLHSSFSNVSAGQKSKAFQINKLAPKHDSGIWLFCNINIFDLLLFKTRGLVDGAVG